MFQLIVAVISIALVAALAIASIYYGGAAFQKSSLKANVTTLVNGGQQIAGAMALYKTDNSGITAVDLDPSLIDGEYLTALPGVSGAAAEGTNWALETTTAGGAVAFVDVNDAGEAQICEEANLQAGLDFDATFPAADEGPTEQFGCYGTAGSLKFGFRL